MGYFLRPAVRYVKVNTFIQSGVQMTPQINNFSSYRKASPLSQLMIKKCQENENNKKTLKPQQIKLRDIPPKPRKPKLLGHNSSLIPSRTGTPKKETEKIKKVADINQPNQHQQQEQQQQQQEQQQQDEYQELQQHQELQKEIGLSPASIKVRLERQIEEAKRFSIQNFSKDMVEVSDALAMALSTVPPEQLNIPALKNVFEGLKMIEALLQQVFSRHGLQQVNPLNEKFDPRYHEALYKRAARGIEPNTIVEVGRVGYKLHNRCIRPALVVVAKKL